MFLVLVLLQELPELVFMMNLFLMHLNLDSLGSREPNQKRSKKGVFIYLITEKLSLSL
ncbi:Uncharacterised protein [Mycobacteroides abscessus subsp. abscessus]|nr:Uncharacterised protein [Mycobacteroides abscessus subsp. abscessus]